MAKVSEAFPSKFISAPDLQGGTAVVTMSHVVMEKIGDDQKPVLYFKGKQKGLVLNKTNAQAIAYAYGDEMDDWQGAQVELFTVMTDFQGKTVEAVRVRMPRNQGRGAAIAASSHQRPADFPGDDNENPAAFRT